MKLKIIEDTNFRKDIQNTAKVIYTWSRKSLIFQKIQNFIKIHVKITMTKSIITNFKLKKKQSINFKPILQMKIPYKTVYLMSVYNTWNSMC